MGVGCVEGGVKGGDITPSRIRVKGMGGLWWVTKGDAPVGVAAVVAVAAVAAAAVAATPNIPNSTRVAFFHRGMITAINIFIVLFQFQCLVEFIF